jgi:galactosamine-6-phosphate isomerase
MALRIIVKKNPEEVALTAAQIIAACADQKSGSSLCVATGASPTRAYQLMIEEAHQKKISLKKMIFVKLDEWLGLPMNDPATCEFYIKQHLLKPLKVKPKNYIRFQSDPRDAEKECRRVRKQLEKLGPLDLCVLGLGANGHLGFNEPADGLNVQPHVAHLSRTSMTHAMLQSSKHKNRVRGGLTLGMGNIMSAQRVLMIVTGRLKAAQLRQMLTGRISPQFPASFLQLHQNALCICDREAAVKIL